MPSIDSQHVIVVAHPQRRAIMIGLAQKFRDVGAKVTLVCSTSQERDYYENRFSDYFDAILKSVLVAKLALEPVVDEEKVIRRAVELEEWCGINFQRLILQNRHLGRGYALAGTRHPKSNYSENTSYAQVLQAYIRKIEFWIDFIAKAKPTLIVGDAGELELVAKQHNLPVRTLVSSRNENYFYWSESVRRTAPKIEIEYKNKPREDGFVSLERPYKANLAYFYRHLKNKTLLKTGYKSCYLIVQYIYWHLRKYEKRKGYFLSEQIKFLWAQRVAFLKLRPPFTKRLADLEGKKFVFYPLHTEPETALQGMSPEFMFQLEAITAIARDLPADTFLVVKETFHALGRRPRDFYNQISAFKNIILLDTNEFGLEIVKKANAVATITGTAGYEAAVLGKPVISFGQHNIYNFLDHVYVVSDLSDLRPQLAECLKPSFAIKKAKSDGSHFFRCLLSISIDLGSFDSLNPDSIDQDILDSVFQSLVDTL